MHAGIMKCRYRTFDAIWYYHSLAISYVRVADLRVLQETIMGMLLIPGLHYPCESSNLPKFSPTKAFCYTVHEKVIYMHNTQTSSNNYSSTHWCIPGWTTSLQLANHKWVNNCLNSSQDFNLLFSVTPPPSLGTLVHWSTLNLSRQYSVKILLYW